MLSHKLGKKGWIKAYRIEGCGVDLLPRIHIGMSFSYPEIKLSWWSFHVEIDIHRQCPNWFMFYVWDLLVNFNWNFGKKDEEE